MITFEELVEQQGARIIEETKQSYKELVERGMVFKKESTGELRLLFNRSWYGTPRRLLLPVPESRGLNKDFVMVHTHLGIPLHSMTDMLNFAYMRGLAWLGTSSLDKKTGKIILRAVRVNTIVPRTIPAIIAYLENQLNYKYGFPTGPRVVVRQIVL